MSGLQSRYSNINFHSLALKLVFACQVTTLGLSSLNKAVLLVAHTGYHFSFLLPFIFHEDSAARILAGLPVYGCNEIYRRHLTRGEDGARLMWGCNIINAFRERIFISSEIECGIPLILSAEKKRWNHLKIPVIIKFMAGICLMWEMWAGTQIAIGLSGRGLLRRGKLWKKIYCDLMSLKQPSS